MIASLVEPVAYDRLATLKLLVWAGGLVLALFVILAAWCAVQGALAGRPTRRRDKR